MGAEGSIGLKNYVVLCGIHELKPLSEAYESREFATGLLIFGSDGGGEAYGFDTRSPDWPVVQIPFVGMSWDDAEKLGETFIGFLKGLAGDIE